MNLLTATHRELRACEEVATETGVDYDTVVRGAFVTETALQMFDYIYHDGTHPVQNLQDLLTALAGITKEQINDNLNVAEYFVGRLTNVYKTPHGYVYFTQ